MLAALDDFPLIKHQHLIGVADGAQTMRDDEGGASLQQAVEGAQEGALPGAGGTEDAEDFAGQQVEVDAVEDEPSAGGDAEAADLEDGIRHGRRRGGGGGAAGWRAARGR